MTLEFLPAAEEEFLASVAYYESKEAGLGRRFRNEIAEVCSTILEHPRLWREHPEGHRRVNCPVFPYYVAYIIRGDAIVVAAVAHGARHPDYWKRRAADPEV